MRLKTGLRFPIAHVLALIFVLVPQVSWSDQTDPASIDQILGTGNPSQPPVSDAEKSKRLLDTLANAQTKLLDQGNREWTSAATQWPAVFSRVRSDIAADLPAIAASIEAASHQLTHDYEVEIASHLSQSDVDAILAYYKSPKGQRYQAFMRRIDRVMLQGMARRAPPNSKDAASSEAKPTPEQMQKYNWIVRLSHMMQSMTMMASIDEAAHRDTSGYGAVIFIAGFAVRKNRPEMDSLAAEYGNDLPAFDAFEKTEASQHLFKAMALAFPALQKSSAPLIDAMKAIQQKHGSEWKAFYLAQTIH